VPAVREVKTLTWEKIDSTIDDNPNNGGGKRIFPDWQTPGDSVNRSRVRVKAQTTMGQGQTVFFKSFDVDDPDTDTTLTVDPNGTAGNDNRGTPNLGTLSAAQATTDSNGVATVEFTTTMQPGDNFMVAASTDQNYLNGLSAVGTSLKDSSGNTLPTNNAKATPMLTVWRQLHMEVDSMGIVFGNKITGTITATSQLVGNNINPPKGGPPTPRYVLTVNKTIEVNRYNKGEGTLIVNNIPYVVDGTDANSVTIFSSTGAPAVGSTFTLLDDDDYNENNDGNDDDGEDVNAIEGPDDEKNTFSLMRNSDDPNKNIFAAAYIRPVYDGAGAPGNTNNQSNEIFFTNVPSNQLLILSQMMQGSVNNENDAYWVAYVQLCYQSDEAADNDPFSEDADGGVTPVAGPTWDVVTSSAQLNNTFSPGSLVFLEAARDIAVEKSSNARIAVAPHEVGHQFGIAGDNPSPIFSFGIMVPGGAPVFVPMHLSLLRWRVHSP
jgi:hypothetical protein